MKFQVTLKDRRTGRETVLDIEALNTTDAMDSAGFFRNTYGNPVKAKPVK